MCDLIKITHLFLILIFIYMLFFFFRIYHSIYYILNCYKIFKIQI
nr:MAG TPA: hypothetical protein [Siphoviridae sp. ctZCl11]